MAHNSLKDMIIVTILLFAGAGASGIFWIIGLPQFGGAAFIITIVFLACSPCIFGYIRSSKDMKKYKEKAIQGKKKCINCSSLIESELKFCTKCGQAFE